MAGEMIVSQDRVTGGRFMISMTIRPDQDRVIIEVDGEPFGVLVRLGKRYRFFASDSVAFRLDRLSFRSPFEAESAVARLVQGNALELAGEKGAT